MPYLGSTIFFATLVAALALAMTAWMLLSRALAPALVDQAEERWTRRPMLTTLFGAVSGGILTGIGAAILAVPLPLVKLLGALYLAGLLVLAFTGMAGLAQTIGRGLSDDETTPYRRLLRGGIVLELSFLLPFVGWFLWLPIALFGGFGATLQSLTLRLARRASEPAHAQA